VDFAHNEIPICECQRGGHVLYIKGFRLQVVIVSEICPLSYVQRSPNKPDRTSLIFATQILDESFKPSRSLNIFRAYSLKKTRQQGVTALYKVISHIP